MFIRFYCEFCAICAKITIFCVFYFESINCQRCERNKNECVSINFHIFKNFQRLFFYWSKKCLDIIKKRSQFSFVKECDCAISKRRVSTTMFFFFRDLHQSLNQTFCVLKDLYDSIKASTWKNSRRSFDAAKPLSDRKNSKRCLTLNKIKVISNIIV